MILRTTTVLAIALLTGVAHADGTVRLNAERYQTLETWSPASGTITWCEGRGALCTVPAGDYTVVDHDNGERYVTTVADDGSGGMGNPVRTPQTETPAPIGQPLPATRPLVTYEQASCATETNGFRFTPGCAMQCSVGAVIGGSCTIEPDRGGEVARTARSTFSEEGLTCSEPEDAGWQLPVGQTSMARASLVCLR